MQGGEKKRNEILQLAVLEVSPTRLYVARLEGFLHVICMTLKCSASTHMNTAYIHMASFEVKEATAWS